MKTNKLKNLLAVTAVRFLMSKSFYKINVNKIENFDMAILKNM